MNSKHQKANKQLSLELKPNSNKVLNKAEVAAKVARVFSFQSKKDNDTTRFRDKIKQDLIRNRVIVD